ncbi:MAG: hypothetical protein ACR2QQ_13055 [Gammaproteobacteria bacterium]
MRLNISPAILSSAAGIMLLWHAGESGAQPILAIGPDADVTEEGLHRVEPSIMEAAWVLPDLDLSKYRRILLMPTAVQFRDVRETSTYAQSKAGTIEFPLNDQRKEWFGTKWREAVDAEFAREESYEVYGGVGEDVLVVQGFLADIVSHFPPESSRSEYTYVQDPWEASVILELRDATTAQLLARTIDRRYGTGLLDIGEAWMRTDDLIERWAAVLTERLDQLTEIASPGGSRTPSWAR